MNKTQLLTSIKSAAKKRFNTSQPRDANGRWASSDIVSTLVQKFKQRAKPDDLLYAAQTGNSQMSRGGTGKPKPPAVQDYLDAAKVLLPPALLADLDQARSRRQNDLKNIEDGLEVAAKIVKQRRAKGERLSQELIDEGKELSRQRQELLAEAQDPVLVKAMDSFRKSLMHSSAISRDEAKQLASAIEIDPALGKDGQTLRYAAAEYFLMTNGGGAGAVQKFARTDDRAYADTTGKLVNVGANPNKAVVFHEMAHHMEAGDPDLGNASLEWLMSRASSSKPQKLAKLTGNAGYGNEMALPDDFLTPYVGKVKRDRVTGKTKPVTEVLSMGVERMSSPEKMVEFYLQDPEHFLFTLGAMRGKR